MLVKAASVLSDYLSDLTVLHPHFPLSFMQTKQWYMREEMSRFVGRIMGCSSTSGTVILFNLSPTLIIAVISKYGLSSIIVFFFL